MDLQTLDIDIQLYNDDFNCYDFIENSVMDFLNFSKMPITDPERKCLNVPLSYDIETSCFTDNNLSPDDNMVVIPYTWQIGIYNHVLIGRYIDDINDFFSDLKKYLDDQKIKSCKIYIHNLPFEFFHTFRVLNNLDKKTLTIDTRTPIQFTLYKKKIIFNDSYQLSNKSLAKTSNELVRKILKQKPIDYTKIRLPETQLTQDEIIYSAFDVYCVNEYIFEMLENNPDTKYIQDIPKTSTGFVRKKLKNNVGCGVDYDLRTLDQQEYYNVLRQCKIHSYEQLEIFRKTFSGGFTHAGLSNVGKIYEDVYHFDFTSSYPTALLTEKYPVTSFYNAFEKKDDDVVPTWFTQGLFVAGTPNDVIKDILFRTSVEKLRELNIGFLCQVELHDVKLKDNVNECIISISHADISDDDSKSEYFENLKTAHIYNGRVHTIKKITLWLTDVDFYEIKKFYNIDEDNIYLKRCQIAKFDYLPFIFKKTILTFYKQKTVLKDTDNEFEYQYYKAMLNSLYGMCVTDPIRPDYEILDGQLEKHLLNEKQKKGAIKQNDLPKKQFIYYPWGVWCTAYARKNLYSAILECGNDYLYADTDSVFVKNFEKHKEYFKKYDENIKNKISRSLKNDYIYKTVEVENQKKEYEQNAKFDVDEEKYLNKINELNEQIERLKQQSQELESLYQECKTIKGVFKPLGVWSEEKHCQKFCTIGAKRYLEQFDNGEIQFTVAGIKKDNIKKFFESNFNNDVDKIFQNFSNVIWDTKGNIFVDEKFSGKVTNYYIDRVQTGSMSNVVDVNGNKYDNVNDYSYEGYGGFYFKPTTFELTIFPDFDYFKKQMALKKFYDDNLGR